METLTSLIEKVKQKTPSMRPRGVAFAVEAMANLHFTDEKVFQRIERVILAKLDEFIPHYIVKVLSSYYKLGYGSGELYDQLIQKVRETMRTPGALKYSDMLRFFEIYPEVTHIYETTMSSEMYEQFVQTVAPLLKDKKFPIEDVCRVFNILVRISPYKFDVDPQQIQQQSDEETKKALELHQKFLRELVGRIRHSIYAIPKDHFALTMSNLIEFQQPDIAGKFTNILKEIVRQGKHSLVEEFTVSRTLADGSTVADHSQLIQLFWSLL